MAVALTASRGGQVLGISGLAAPENRLNTLLPMATVALTGLINMFWLRPLTTRIMRERKHQGISSLDEERNASKLVSKSDSFRNP